jgi:ectoine hydroxylase-related dioxygenase (phytanoyl-CoA dioxygenase family)
MSYIFKDPLLEFLFSRDGFVVLPNALNMQLLLELKNLYQETKPQPGKTFYTSHWISNPEYKLTVNNKIKAILGNDILKHLHLYNAVYHYFMVKHPGDTSFNHAHQDWNTIDEKKGRGVSIWAPLIDTNSNNGTMRILKGSHFFYKNLRGTGIEMPYDCYKVLNHPAFQTVNLNAGDVLFFDQAVVHATHDNQSCNERVALGNILIPRCLPLLHYYSEDNLVKSFKCTDDFFIRYSFGQDLSSFIQ